MIKVKFQKIISNNLQKVDKKFYETLLLLDLKLSIGLIEDFSNDKWLGLILRPMVKTEFHLFKKVKCNSDIVENTYSKPVKTRI